MATPGSPIAGPIPSLAAALSNRLRLLATLNLEGLTIPEGELTPGAWGEGFIDRRHPHTSAHELMGRYGVAQDTAVVDPREQHGGHHGP